MSDVVFNDKDFLVNFLYSLLDNPTKIKVQKTLYLLYAFYGATYGNLNAEGEENEFSNHSYPKRLFNANFEALRYGPVESEVYANEKSGRYSAQNLATEDVDTFFNTSEMRNIREFIENIASQTNNIDDFSLVDRTHQDNVWLNKYKEGERHIQMDNDEIVQEYIKRYV